MSSKDDKKKRILEAFEEINQRNHTANWNLLNQIALQVTGFIEKYRYREDVRDSIDSRK